MQEVRIKRKVTKWVCCPEPWAEIFYHLKFVRRPSFYILYLILPFIFISVLSLLVFILPAECGEKVSLSITNLLALVVFQQLIAETMPPSGDDPPLIGKTKPSYNDNNIELRMGIFTIKVFHVSFQNMHSN